VNILLCVFTFADFVTISLFLIILKINIAVNVYINVLTPSLRYIDRDESKDYRYKLTDDPDIVVHATCLLCCCCI